MPDPVGDPATIPLGGSCDLDERYGAFNTDVYDIYSIVAGSVAEGVVPNTILELVDQEGTCQLLRRNNPFCDPLCGPNEVCDFDGTCKPYPLNQDVGTVTIGGLAADVIMTPIEPGTTYFDLNAPHPVFTPGDLVELRTWNTTFGDDIVLHGVGVSPLSLGTNYNWVIYDNQDLPVTWNDKGASLQSQVLLRLNIDQHGATPVTMVCELPDTGSANLPGRLIHTLINYGVTGFPSATVVRRTIDSTTMGGGCVELQVGAPAACDGSPPNCPTIRVDGFIPCSGSGLPGDCPRGQTCNPVTFICE
ncbi:MAG: hypothetical protein KC621_15215 [Myxococcales bacterium]|nr:hypothetical protein [Myxococcales bacterium]